MKITYILFLSLCLLTLQTSYADSNDATFAEQVVGTFISGILTSNTDKQEAPQENKGACEASISELKAQLKESKARAVKFRNKFLGAEVRFETERSTSQHLHSNVAHLEAKLEKFIKTNKSQENVTELNIPQQFREATLYQHPGKELANFEEWVSLVMGNRKVEKVSIKKSNNKNELTVVIKLFGRMAGRYTFGLEHKDVFLIKLGMGNTIDQPLSYVDQLGAGTTLRALALIAEI